jgi:putative FmdB family regulatory protein
MPVYEYLCAACGPFTALRPMAEYEAPHACPECGATVARAILTPLRLASLSVGTRKAHALNERSRHEPKALSAADPAGHHHPAGGDAASRRRTSEAPPAAKSFPGRRPWMISH